MHGPNPGEIYPCAHHPLPLRSLALSDAGAADYGKPCGRQSDCAQCTVDHACTCTKIPNSNHSCCQPNGLAPHVDREPYAFGVPLDPNLPGTENATFTSFKAIVRTPPSSDASC